MDSRAFSRSSLFESLKTFGLGRYNQINYKCIDEFLRRFSAKESVTGLNTAAQDMLLELQIKDEKVVAAQEERKDKKGFEKIEAEYWKVLEEYNCTPAEFFKERYQVNDFARTTMYRHMKKFKEYFATK